MIIQSIKKFLYSIHAQRYLSARRFRLIDHLLDGRLIEPNQQRKRMLDVGCSIGKDFVTLLKGREDVEIFGLDLKDYGLRQKNFHMIVGNADHIPFPDLHFDITVSIGVLEHIRPIEKLAKVTKEIVRVSKSYVVIVPSLSTIIEPHVSLFFWQLRDSNRKPIYPGTLIYMNDEAWLAFASFEGAKTHRYWQIPPLIANLFIYKTPARPNKKAKATW